MLGLLVFLVIADGLLTNVLINHDVAREWNPFLGVIAGRNTLVVIKILGAVTCVFILRDIYKHWPKLAAISIYTFAFIYSIIVVWNLFLLFSQLV